MIRYIQKVLIIRLTRRWLLKRRKHSFIRAIGQCTQLMTILIMISPSQKRNLSARNRQNMRSHTLGPNDLRQCFRRLYSQKLTGHKITERTPKRSSKVVETKWAQNEWILTIILIEGDLKLNLVTGM